MCDYCDNPFRWKTVNETATVLTVKCHECNEIQTFDIYGKCPSCGFWYFTQKQADEGYCEMCDDIDSENDDSDNIDYDEPGLMPSYYFEKIDYGDGED